MKSTLFKRYEVPFVQVPREIINATDISWKAKGLMAYLLDKPNEWEFTLAGIAQQGNEGETSVRSGLKELEKSGYLRRTRIRNENTKLFEKTIWEICPFKKFSTTSGFSTCGEISCGGTATRNTQDTKVSKKDSLEIEHTPIFNSKSKKETKNLRSYGKHVKMTKEDEEGLLKIMNEDKLNDIIETMNDAISAGSCRTYKDYPAAIRIWYKREKKEIEQKQTIPKKQQVDPEVIKKRKQWAEKNTWVAPGGYAEAQETDYLVYTAGSKGISYPYDQNLSFWSDLNL